MTIVECTRHHGFPFGREAVDPTRSPYYVARCAHLRNRFIVEIRNARPVSAAFIALDYVEDQTPDGAEIVEAHNPYPAEADALWSRLYARMTSGDGPRADDV